MTARARAVTEKRGGTNGASISAGARALRKSSGDGCRHKCRGRTGRGAAPREPRYTRRPRTLDDTPCPSRYHCSRPRTVRFFVCAQGCDGNGVCQELDLRRGILGARCDKVAPKGDASDLRSAHPVDDAPSVPSWQRQYTAGVQARAGTRHRLAAIVNLVQLQLTIYFPDP